MSDERVAARTYGPRDQALYAAACAILAGFAASQLSDQFILTVAAAVVGGLGGLVMLMFVFIPTENFSYDSERVTHWVRHRIQSSMHVPVDIVSIGFHDSARVGIKFVHLRSKTDTMAIPLDADYPEFGPWLLTRLLQSDSLGQQLIALPQLRRALEGGRR